MTSDVDRSGLVELLRWVRASFEEHVGFAMVGTILASEEAIAHLWRDKSTTPTLRTLREHLEAGVRQGVLSAWAARGAPTPNRDLAAARIGASINRIATSARDSMRRRKKRV